MKISLHIAAALLLAMSSAWASARADSTESGRHEHDHDDAYSAREQGDVMPLAQILAIAQSQIAGEIIEIEFEADGGLPIYEFLYVDPQGRVRTLDLDARTGSVLENGTD